MMELCIGTRSVRGTRMKSTDPRFFDTVVFPMLRYAFVLVSWHIQLSWIPQQLLPYVLQSSIIPSYTIIICNHSSSTTAQHAVAKYSTVEIDVEVRMHEPQHRC
jgi:hypothetical protein